MAGPRRAPGRSARARRGVAAAHENGTRRRSSARIDPGERLALSVWIRLLRAHTLILREVRRDFGGEATLPQFDVLAQLARERDGLTLAGLARRLLVSAGNLTGIVDRLERDRLVRRGPDLIDGRAFRVRLTARGRARVWSLSPRHARRVESLLGGLTSREQEDLGKLLGRLGERIAAGNGRGSDTAKRSASSAAWSGEAATSARRPSAAALHRDEVRPSAGGRSSPAPLSRGEALTPETRVRGEM